MTDTLEPHLLAGIFPLMSGDNYDKFKQDIKVNGLREPIWLYEGKILDGRNRHRACSELGLTPQTKTYTGTDPRGFVISINLHRRHLTPEQKRDIIAELLKANPQASDRVIAAQAKASPSTVGEVRKATVQDGQLRKGRDGKTRRVPDANPSDGYDKAQASLLRRLQLLPLENAEAAASETVKELNRTVRAMKAGANNTRSVTAG